VTPERNTEKLFRDCRFLIIEDDDGISEFLEELFTAEEGAKEVIVCRSIEEVPIGKNSFSAVVANLYTVGQISSYDLRRNGTGKLSQQVERLRKTCPETPIVFIHSMKEELIRIDAEVRAEAWIVYPFELEELLGILVGVIKPSKN